jgi:hypothetical protein
MSTERETESCKVFVGFVLPSTGISNRDRDRAMGHCLWMDGWTGWMTGWMDGKLHEKRPRRPLLYVMVLICWFYLWFCGVHSQKSESTVRKTSHTPRTGPGRTCYPFPIEPHIT